MKIRSFIFKLISNACVICVAVSLLFFAAASIVTANSLDGQLGISFSQYALFILFSLLLAAAAYLFRLPLPRSLCLLIHFVVTAICFFVMFAVAGKLNLKSFGGAMVFFALFTLLYLLFLGLYLLFKRIVFPEKTKNKRKEEVPYEKRF